MLCLQDEDLIAQIIKKATLLFGFSAPHYDVQFFKDVAGLCGAGRDIGEIIDADLNCGSSKKLFPLELVAEANRLKLKNGTDLDIVEFLSHMYH